MNLADLSWPQVEALDRDIPVVIPVAALEQHGRHMPVFTDSMLLGEVVRRVSERVRTPPCSPLSRGWATRTTTSIFPAHSLPSPACTSICWGNSCHSSLATGSGESRFSTATAATSPPGSRPFSKSANSSANADLLLLFATYWECVPAGYERPKDFIQSDMGHACEWETSMILRIAPQLVANPQAVPDVSSGYGFEPAYRGWTTKDRTAPGHIGGSASRNGREGEHLFQTFANGVVEYLDRVRAWDGGTW